MNLPDEQNPNEIPAPKPDRRPRKAARLWLASLVAIGAIAFAVCFWPEPRPADLKDGFAWLTPSDTVKAFGPPGSLTRLKFRVLMWSPRIWKWYTGAKTQVHLTISFLNVPGDSDLTGTVLANARCFTNAEDGMRGWVLTADQWEQVRRSFDSWTKSSLRLTTMEGMAATMYSGSQGADGATISLSPRVKRKAFDLLLNASYSGPSNAMPTSTPTPIPTPTNSVVVQQPGGGAQIVITNLAVTCRAIVPNGGALIVDGHKNSLPDTPPTNGTYWLIISPVAVDSAGNAKKM